MQYFRHIDHRTPIEEIMRQFHELAMRFHPDKGGSNEDMAAILAEFAALKRTHSHIHQASNGSVYESDSQDDGPQVPEGFEDIIQALVTIDGIEVEIVGTWVWVSGDTYPNRGRLKELGFRWAKSHQKWYLAGDSGGRHRRSGKTFDEIVATYGSRFTTKGVGAPLLAS